MAGLLDNQYKFPAGAGIGGIYKLPKGYNVKNEIKDIALLANSFAPVTGDIQSGLLSAQDLKQGNYGSAALNGLGLLPFIPSMGGVVKNIGKEVNAYPLAPAGTRYEEYSGNLTYMTPDEYLRNVRPLTLNESSLDNIADLKRHVESGGKLDPLAIYPNGKEDGRHRAYLAKELGINQVPVALHGRTKYEIQQATAQKNAVEMLGLPPNNTAMDRAMAMGHDTPAYTGVNTTGEINEMLPKSWFSEQPKYASDYSDVIPKSGVSQEPRVYPVMLKTGKVKSKQYVGLYDDMESALSKKNIDTFKVENVGGGSNNFYVIKNPNQVRSIHAAFDPARANEADLLGNITPEMAGLLAVGSGAGVGYAYNKKEKKKTK